MCVSAFGEESSRDWAGDGVFATDRNCPMYWAREGCS